MKVRTYQIGMKASLVLLFVFVAVFAQAQKTKPQKFTFVKKVTGFTSPNLGKTIAVEGDLIGKVEAFGGAEVLVYAKDKGKEILVTNLNMLPQLAKNNIDYDLSKPKELYTVSYSIVPKGLGNDLNFEKQGNAYRMAISVDNETDAKIISEVVSVHEQMCMKPTPSRISSVLVGGFKSEEDFEKFKAMFK